MTTAQTTPMTDTEDTYELVQIQYHGGKPSIPTAAVKLKDGNGQEYIGNAIGDGPIDALYKAITNAISLNIQFVEFRVKSITQETEGNGEVHFTIQFNGYLYNGVGVSTDIVVASALALIYAINQAIAASG